MRREALLFVARDRNWLKQVGMALEDSYDVRTASSLQEAKELCPGKVFGLIFVTWMNKDAPRQELAELINTPRGKKRVVVILPRHEFSFNEYLSFFRLGAFSVIDKPREGEDIKPIVDDELEAWNKARARDAGRAPTGSTYPIPA